MAVAKTYQHMEIQGEPFEENKRMYVNVLAPKGIKKVRWYTDTEYSRMYPEEVTKHDIMDFNARHVFGFGDLGYITVYKGPEGDLEAFADAHHESFRRNLTFGYYTPSRLTVPKLPDNITAIRLDWSAVMDHNDRMKPHEEVTKYVNSLLILDGASKSQYQGDKDEWIEKTLTVRENKSHETQFGDKHTMVLVDAQDNVYVWETGSKNFKQGAQVSLKMKVKAHQEINGEKCTIVWYCKEK